METKGAVPQFRQVCVCAFVSIKNNERQILYYWQLSWKSSLNSLAKNKHLIVWINIILAYMHITWNWKMKNFSVDDWTIGEKIMWRKLFQANQNFRNSVKVHQLQWIIPWKIIWEVILGEKMRITESQLSERIWSLRGGGGGGVQKLQIPLIPFPFQFYLTNSDNHQIKNFLKDTLKSHLQSSLLFKPWWTQMFLNTEMSCSMKTFSS